MSLAGTFPSDRIETFGTLFRMSSKLRGCFGNSEPALSFLPSKPGLGTKMSQNEQREQGAAQAKPRARKDWELFWRIIAGLMLLVVAWVAWVTYQIMPRSVVTPLAYVTRIRPIGVLKPGLGAAAPAVPPPAAEAAAAESAEPAQAAAADAGNQPGRKEGLRLATEIAAPPAEEQRIPGKEESGSGAVAVPAPAGAAGKDRP